MSKKYFRLEKKEDGDKEIRINKIRGRMNIYIDCDDYTTRTYPQLLKDVKKMVDILNKYWGSYVGENKPPSSQSKD